jgi:ribose 5-phosphate isomerase A
MSAPEASDASDDPRVAAKRAAAERAVEWVETGMVVGLGTGSTAIWAIRRIGALLADGSLRDVVGIPTSTASADEARGLGIPLSTLDDHPTVDLTIDGADEVDPGLDLIKGGGGALLREKIVAQASRRVVIVVDDSKLSPRLGTTWPVPVEVVPFAWVVVANALEALGAEPVLRRAPASHAPFVTDESNWIIDAHFGPIDDPDRLGATLAARSGIVDHGLFIGLVDAVLVAGASGVEVRTR